MRPFNLFTTLSTLIPIVPAQSPLHLPLTIQCHPSPNVLCINSYLSVLPYHFSRASPNSSSVVPLSTIQLPPAYNATSAALASASFLIFDATRGVEVLGAAPTYDFMFAVSNAVHEAPVYAAAVDRLFLSQLAPTGFLPQLVVDLSGETPRLEEFLSDPPVYAPNGGTFAGGLIYWAASGGNMSIGGIEQRAGVRTLDPLTNKTETLLNNYFGYYFNTVDDIVVDAKGDVWFTDPQYSWFNNLTDTPPQLTPATYRFRPSTGAVSVVEDTLTQPNGIAISPDQKTMYLSDTGADTGVIDPRFPSIHSATFNATGKRTVYKYDIVDNGTAIVNKRPIYLAQEWAPDGLKVAANGMVVTATGMGMDVLDEFGTLIVRIQTNYTVENFAWVANKKDGGRLTEVWMTGNRGIARVRWALEGQTLK